ncbi:MAG TPA: cysteine--tRNA ligase, partial [Sphingomonadales bacterium]|nr:cysteine--tRNA ligase [Sphingomonadales bacterium]
HLYGEKSVVYARNITDIDDKIIKAAAEENVSIEVITKRYAKAYAEDVMTLGALTPTLEPKATETLPAMIAMMEKLIAAKHAYVAEGHVLFHVPTMKDYGKLSKKPREDLIAGARVEVAPYKKDPADFVLWKPSAAEQPGWESPWGRGRPGWHLECSSMVEQHLGETIDIHGGGLDLVFPHHENEIAQSKSSHNGKDLARFWVHNGYLTLKGEKMSKSLGNIVTIHGLLEKYPGEALRLALLSAHYRQPLDFSEDLVKEQKRRLDRWQRLTVDTKRKRVKAGDVPKKVLAALMDDLNTPEAVAALEAEKNPPDLLAGANFLGLIQVPYNKWFQGKMVKNLDELEALINERLLAKKNKDFAKADEIRKLLQASGVTLEDTPRGTIWRFKD